MQHVFLILAVKSRGVRENLEVVVLVARGFPFGALLLTLEECLYQVLLGHFARTAVSSVGDRSQALYCQVELLGGQLKLLAYFVQLQAQQIHHLDLKGCSQL